jgi:fermentation-respiration switch protein FrsA (DUF1100 family)
VRFRAYYLLLVLTTMLWGCAVVDPVVNWERHGVFHPQKYPTGEWTPTTVLVQDAWMTAGDGTRLHGWYVRHPEPKAHALVLHGNAGNVTVLAESLRLLNRKHGLSVLALDYRGFGRSDGTPSEKGILLDARAARDWLAEKEGVAPADIMLMGQSLGGGVAVDLASTDGCRGLVLASTFTSIPDVAQHHVWWMPMKLLMSMRLDSLQKIKQYNGPLLVSHGEADEVIPYKQGLALYEAAPGPKRLITAKGAKHNDPQPEEYRKALDEFIRDLPPLTKSPKNAEPSPAAISWPTIEMGL